MLKNNDFAISNVDKAQYIFSIGDTVDVEKKDAKVGEKLTFTDVMLVQMGDQTHIGKPYVKDAKIICKVILQGRDRKVKTMTYSAKSRYRKTYGNKQFFTRLLVEEISVGTISSKVKPKSTTTKVIKENQAEEKPKTPKSTKVSKPKTVKKTVKKVNKTK